MPAQGAQPIPPRLGPSAGGALVADGRQCQGPGGVPVLQQGVDRPGPGTARRQDAGALGRRGGRVRQQARQAQVGPQSGAMARWAGRRGARRPSPRRRSSAGGPGPGRPGAGRAGRRRRRCAAPGGAWPRRGGARPTAWPGRRQTASRATAPEEAGRPGPGSSPRRSARRPGRPRRRGRRGGRTGRPARPAGTAARGRRHARGPRAPPGGCARREAGPAAGRRSLVRRQDHAPVLPIADGTGGPAGAGPPGRTGLSRAASRRPRRPSPGTAGGSGAGRPASRSAGPGRPRRCAPPRRGPR